MTDFLRLHLIPRRALGMQSATLDDCIEHARLVADDIAKSLALDNFTVEISSRRGEGGRSYLLLGGGVGVMYGCFLGDYFDKEVLSEHVRSQDVQHPLPLKSYLLIRNPQTETSGTILSSVSVLHHDSLIHHEQGYPQGWQAFVRRHGPGQTIDEKKWRQHITTLKRGNAALEILGFQPSEWIAKTDDGYVLRTATPMHLS